MVIETVFFKLIVIFHFEHHVCSIDSEVFNSAWSLELRISKKLYLDAYVTNDIIYKDDKEEQP